MEHSGRKNVLIPSSSFDSPSAKSKTNKNSIAKSQRSFFSHESSIERNKLQSNLKKMMTSDLYNRIFNKLMNISSLKEFVKQSSQYVEFTQDEVKKFIPPVHSQRFRFSFSLKSSNSICSFLAKDYRFLKRYYELLQIEFPEKKEQLRDEIYRAYKDEIVNRNKFDEYFGPNHLNSIKAKEESKFKSKSKKQNENPLKFAQSEKKIIMKTLSGAISQQITKNISKFRTQNKSKQKRQNNIQQAQLAELKKPQPFQSQPSGENSQKWNINQRRTTQQNLKLIQETLMQIEHIKASFPTQEGSKIQAKENLNPNMKEKIKVSSKKEVLTSKKNIVDSKKKAFSQKKINPQFKKERIDNQKTIGSKIDQNGSQKVQDSEKNQESAGFFDEEAMYERMIARRMSNKPKKVINETEEQRQQRLLGIQPINSKMKSKKKDQYKTVKFSDLIDINDPKHKEFLEKFDKMEVEKQKEKEKRNQEKDKQDELRKRITIRIAQLKRQVRHTFGQNEKKALIPNEQEIVSLFPAISSIGGWKHYTFDRGHFSYVELGEYCGYKIEKIGCWPTEDSEVDEVYFCLYLKKIPSSDEENPVESERNSKEIEKLKQELQKINIQAITILFIEK